MATKVVDPSVFTIHLVSWHKTCGEVPGKRYYFSPEGDGYQTVELTPANEISCRCAAYDRRYKTGEGDVCRHVQEALDFMDTVGFKAMRQSPMASRK